MGIDNYRENIFILGINQLVGMDDKTIKKNDLPNKLMHVVSSKTVLAIEPVLSKVIVQKNNQNNGDFITFALSISVLTTVPGINISIHINRLIITKIKVNADLRHLYLSVMAPIAGRISKPGSGSIVNIKPTMSDE